jgi:hypothetical protein
MLIHLQNIRPSEFVTSPGPGQPRHASLANAGQGIVSESVVSLSGEWQTAHPIHMYPFIINQQQSFVLV